jgi:hypothetical protein
MHIEFKCGNLKGRDHLEELVVNGGLILNYMLQT